LPPEKDSFDDSTTMLPLAIVHTALNLQSLVAAEFAHGNLLIDLPEREASGRLHLAYQVLQI
jgi:hypothetical protein